MDSTGGGAASAGEEGWCAQPACTIGKRRTNAVSAGRRREIFRIRGQPPSRDKKVDVPERHDADTVAHIAAPRQHERFLDLHLPRTRNEKGATVFTVTP